MCKVKDQLIDMQVTFLEKNPTRRAKKPDVGFNNRWAHDEHWAYDKYRDNQKALEWGVQFN